ncbi:MAG: bifunctional oligoribonuclease/PAP phosphatase NrnA [candidate division KSB1 bacterium]|nr:bifunctional oligoribonuclease/PAP phosphatase NrnA [candidate division KSB1 bacterium]MDZ7334340.1 bifunctional oligoribonuclease/PAP phosphatase NrnA [candidate division KSB1 bacterium]MDZ7356381.1 bifunctional oligoribonuclease/PAP phosphatase NrnA [candidate division KSB1 bacterium]MDZ7399311.1 bifunctional oligoribonuclease/PAP phosphatase NrnA [candidate division KSB1 bacterium]
MLSDAEVAKLNELISAHQKFVLTTHINPDGDAIGSEIAMTEYLRGSGKHAIIINNSATPNNYKFLDRHQEIIVYDEQHRHLITDADAFIIVDISDWERLRTIGQLIKNMSAPKICIDHHHINYRFADLDIIHEEASSTGEIVYDFLVAVNFPINGIIAEALYTCLLSDTGSFRFSNTTAKTHRVASHLLELGINVREIHHLVYEQNSRSKMALLGEALRNLHYECDGRLAWFVLSEQMFQSCQASHWDTEGFPEIPRTIEGVDVSLMFTELDKDKVKISLRSKGKVVIHQIAEKFGGGGHHYAAGALVNSSLNEIVPIVVSEIKQLLGCE